MPPGPWLCLALLLAARAQSSWGPWPSRAQPPWPSDLGISISSARRARSYHHLEGDVRWRRLYSSTHFFLHIGPSGRVEGTRQPYCPNSIVEIRSVRVGVVAIKAVYTGFYLAMNRRGKLYGTREYSPNCKFMERIEENGYNTYASLRWRHEGRQMFLALDGRGAPRQGGRTRRQHLSTHFLPILVS